jgi:hypothetical protein
MTATTHAMKYLAFGGGIDVGGPLEMRAGTLVFGFTNQSIDNRGESVTRQNTYDSGIGPRRSNR